MTKNLRNRLMQADVVCADCGSKYGELASGYTLSMWEDTCGVCLEDKPVADVEVWSYLIKGSLELEEKTHTP